MLDILNVPSTLTHCIASRIASYIDYRVTSVLLVAAMLLFSSASSVASEKCQISNPALEVMPPVQVLITRVDGSEYSIMAKLADNDYTRAAGFQRVCASTMKETPILFVFESEIVPSFHMNNVVAPIDIAFIKKDSSIDVIHQMQPYSLISLNKPLYASKTPIIAALETHKGFFEDNNVDLASAISWSVVETEEGKDSQSKSE